MLSWIYFFKCACMFLNGLVCESHWLIGVIFMGAEHFPELQQLQEAPESCQLGPLEILT